MTDLVALLRSRDVAVYWVGLPRMKRESFDGKMGVMDYYNLQNLQSDTGMRSAIAGIGGKGGQPPQG